MKKHFLIAILLSLAFVSLILNGCASTAEGVQNDFRKVTQSVMPAIVKIDVVEIIKDQNTRGRDGKPLFDFFYDDENGAKPDQEFRQESLGSGILVKRVEDRFYAVTNAHVISDAQEITVTLDDGRSFLGSLVGKDERKDLALVMFKCDDATIPLVRLGDSDAAQVGDWVLAMGAPYGYQSTVTAGIISALHRRGGPGGNINDFIQTDASINKGNSGGALVDIHGNVIGINTWITSQSGDSVGLGFSIPINNVKHAIIDFIEAGKIRYGWLGVSVSSLDKELASGLGYKSERGALVTSLYEGSPASRAGLQLGDIIISLNGKPINSADDIIQSVGELMSGDKPLLSVSRSGKLIRINPEISLRQEDEALAKNSIALWPGFSIYPLSDQVRKDLAVADGLRGVIVRQVIAQSPAVHAGLKNRDIIIAINDKSVETIQQYFDLLNTSDRSQTITIKLVRDGKTISVQFVAGSQRQNKAP